jgi:hypothetical protein
MWARTILLRSFLGLFAAVVLTGRGLAELLTALFPDLIPAFDLGDDPPVHEGPWIVRPELEAGTGVASSLPAAIRRRSAPETVIAPSLGVATGWSRHAIGAGVSVRDTRFAGLPAMNRTDAAIAAGGRMDIGHDRLSLSASHTVLHEDRGQIGAVAASRPIAVTIGDVRAAYTIAAGRWTLEPSVQATKWTYGNTAVQGMPLSQSYRDRLTLRGGAALRYEMAPKRDLILVLRAAGQTYLHTPPGVASLDSTAGQILAGIDYDDTVWRWRLLVGAENRHFASPAYPTRRTAIAEAAATWAPTGLTTVNALLARETQDAAQEGVAGLVFNAVRLTVDHEYARDLLLRLSLGWQQASFFGGGSQSGTSVQASATKVLNRQARVVVSLSQTDLHSAHPSAGSLAGGYSGGLALLSLHLGM